MNKSYQVDKVKGLFQEITGMSPYGPYIDSQKLDVTNNSFGSSVTINVLYHA